MGAAHRDYLGPGLLSGQAKESEDYSGGEEANYCQVTIVHKVLNVLNVLNFGARLGVRGEQKLTKMLNAYQFINIEI